MYLSRVPVIAAENEPIPLLDHAVAVGGHADIVVDDLGTAIEEIENMPNIDTPAFQFERIRSLKYLRSTLKQVLEQKMSPLEQLKKELDAAVEEENYELAAKLRDKIRTLKKEFEL